MGWRFNDDYANPVRAVLRDVEGVDVYLAGHSHQDQPSWTLHDVLCSQASYHGIHCGRIDLTFDLDSRKLVDRRAFTLLMDDRFGLDPAVMELARPGLEAADAQSRPRCRHRRPRADRRQGPRQCPRERCSANASPPPSPSRACRSTACFTGASTPATFRRAGSRSADCWRIIPYENMLVTAEVTRGGAAARSSRRMRKQKDSDRTLWPFEVVGGRRRPAGPVLRRGATCRPTAGSRSPSTATTPSRAGGG